MARIYFRTTGGFASHPSDNQNSTASHISFQYVPHSGYLTDNYQESQHSNHVSKNEVEEVCRKLAGLHGDADDKWIEKKFRRSKAFILAMALVIIGMAVTFIILEPFEGSSFVGLGMILLSISCGILISCTCFSTKLNQRRNRIRKAKIIVEGYNKKHKKEKWDVMHFPFLIFQYQNEVDSASGDVDKRNIAENRA